LKRADPPAQRAQHAVQGGNAMKFLPNVPAFIATMVPMSE
jgi:hypothetical protein